MHTMVLRFRPFVPPRDDRRGAMALVFAMMIVPLMLAIGGAIDYARAVQFRAALQSIADSAAIAGATAYVNATASAGGAASAQAYFTTGEGNLPPHRNLRVTVTPSTLSAGAQTTAYQITVTASADVATTFLGVALPSIPVSTTAVAINPLLAANGDLGNWLSSAWDWNTVYWYNVPADNSIPPDSALHKMFSNVGVNAAADLAFQVTASQRIGFALKNITGGRLGYGPNSYGAPQGSTHVFYSQLANPNSLAYPANPQDCSLGVAAIPNKTAIPDPRTGVCYPPTQQKYAAPSCGQISGLTISYNWNDMGGGGSDDRDYNDAQFTFSCGGLAPVAGGGPTTVVLVR